MSPFDKIFHLPVDQYPKWKRYLVRVLQFLAGMASEFTTDKCQIRAQGMAYTSLLALVPLVAIMFAMFSAFPAYESVKEQVQTFIFSQFMPTNQDVIVQYIEKFSKNASKLGLVGLIGFLLGAIMMLDNIEKNFNEIWAVSKKRKFFNKLTSYTTLLVFGTFLLGASFSITAKIKAALHLDEMLQVGFFSKIYLGFSPFAMSFLAFLLMYKVVPYTRVKIKSAAFGAFWGALMFEMAKNFIATSVGSSVKYNAVYGAMAAVPIFLIGLYLSWMVVLIGLEITYTHQNFRALLTHRIYTRPTGRARLSLFLKFFTFIAGRFYLGQQPASSEELSDRFDIPSEVTNDFLEILEERNLVREVVGKDEGYVPAVSLDAISLKEVLSFLFTDPKNGAQSQEKIEKAVEKSLNEFQQAGFDALGDLTMLDFVKRMESKI